MVPFDLSQYPVHAQIRIDMKDDAWQLIGGGHRGIEQ
jgi:hypothetical protein